MPPPRLAAVRVDGAWFLPRAALGRVVSRRSLTLGRVHAVAPWECTVVRSGEIMTSSGELSVNRAGSSTPEEPPILLASPDTKAARALAETLRRAQLGFVQAKTPAQALSCLEDHAFDLVIAGGSQDSRQKNDLVERLNQLMPELAILGLLEGEQAPDDRGPGNGAFDYIARPFDAESTLDTVMRAL